MPRRPVPVSVGDLHVGTDSLYPVVDDCSTMSQPPPRTAFNDVGNASFDNLSSSFKSIYNSLFGQSDDFQRSPLPLGMSTSPTTQAGLSSSVSYDPHRHYDPQFTSLMDGIKELAESNSWDRLTPTQIQNLRESFNEGDHERFGMDSETYSQLSTSFSQFLSKLDDRFLSSSCGLPTEFMSPANVPVHVSRMAPPLYSPYTRSELTCSNISPPATSLAARPHPVVVSQDDPHRYDPPYSVYLPPLHDSPPVLVSAASGTHQEHVPHFKSAATDLFDDNDEDDFDWSKFM